MTPVQRQALTEFLMSIVENSFAIEMRLQAAALLIELENS